ncbi:MAG: DUF4190 domain-containing protein [Nocardioidaceae bacterium]|nr:MAG: DUF4190 domain-containing protein [Nocardioidaceae bacterium]
MTEFGYQAPQPAHPRARTALVLGIISLTGITLCGLGLFLAPIAWAAGFGAMRDIDRAPGFYAGRSEAKAGMICGIIGSVLLVLTVLALTALLLAGPPEPEPGQPTYTSV